MCTVQITLINQNLNRRNIFLYTFDFLIDALPTQFIEYSILDRDTVFYNWNEIVVYRVPYTIIVIYNVLNQFFFAASNRSQTTDNAGQYFAFHGAVSFQAFNDGILIIKFCRNTRHAKDIHKKLLNRRNQRRTTSKDYLIDVIRIINISIIQAFLNQLINLC